MATNRFADIIMFDKNAYVWIQFMLIMGVIEDKSWGKISIGPENGLAPSRYPGITVERRIYVSVN